MTKIQLRWSPIQASKMRDRMPPKALMLLIPDYGKSKPLSDVTAQTTRYVLSSLIFKYSR